MSVFFYKYFFFSGIILQPTNNILTPQSSAQVEDNTQSKVPPLANVGQTWSNAAINIDLDNLMSTKSKSSNQSLSMNQLKLQSPVKQSPAPPMMSPPPLHINNNAVNNNFNNLNNNFGAMFSPTQQQQQQQQPNILSGNVQATTNQQPFFGSNLMSTANPNANNLNNQFNAFQ